MLSMYPACFYKEAEGYSVVFPDLNNLATQGDTFEEAMEMAVDCLAGSQPDRLGRAAVHFAGQQPVRPHGHVLPDPALPRDQRRPSDAAVARLQHPLRRDIAG